MVRILSVAISMAVLAYGMVAQAQQYPQGSYPQPAAQQLSDNYGMPGYAPQPVYAVPQPQYQQQPAAQPQSSGHEGEYGSSVMTDIRQMNF